MAAMRLSAYLRVSTDRQAEEGLGPEIQLEAIRRWAKEMDHQIVRVHRDDGISGATELDNRPGLLDALTDLRDRRVHGVVVYRLDRLARDLVLQEQLLREIWRLDAVAFSTSNAESAFLSEDPDDPSRRLIRQILGAVSEYERSLISLRLRAGRRRKAEVGGYAGYGSPPLGYHAVDGELVPAIHEQRTIARMHELRAAGSSYREIAGVLHKEGHLPKRGGSWHPTTIARALRTTTQSSPPDHPRASTSMVVQS
jgi:DNA invertase Pin-like site-specific DNA recombinase